MKILILIIVLVTPGTYPDREGPSPIHVSSPEEASVELWKRTLNLGFNQRYEVVLLEVDIETKTTRVVPIPEIKFEKKP